MQGARPVPPAEKLQKSQEVGARVSLAARADDRPDRHIQRRVQPGQSVACVVMGLARRQARSEWEDRLRPVQRLDLGRLIDAQHDGVGRRVQIQTDHVVDLVPGVGIGAELEGLDPWGCRSCAFQLVGRRRRLGPPRGRAGF